MGHDPCRTPERHLTSMPRRRAPIMPVQWGNRRHWTSHAYSNTTSQPHAWLVPVWWMKVSIRSCAIGLDLPDFNSKSHQRMGKCNYKDNIVSRKTLALSKGVGESPVALIQSALCTKKVLGWSKLFSVKVYRETRWINGSNLGFYISKHVRFDIKIIQIVEVFAMLLRNLIFLYSKLGFITRASTKEYGCRYWCFFT